MIAYKCVMITIDKYRSVSHYSLLDCGLGHLSQQYIIGEKTFAPSTKVFNRLYCFKTYEQAIAFRKKNPPIVDCIFECEVKPLKSIRLYPFDLMPSVYKEGRLHSRRRDTPDGTIPCEWVKPLRIV